LAAPAAQVLNPAESRSRADRAGQSPLAPLREEILCPHVRGLQDEGREVEMGNLSSLLEDALGCRIDPHLEPLILNRPRALCISKARPAEDYFCTQVRPSQSPLTESNRRPSPYHGDAGERCAHELFERPPREHVDDN
jgi:hypothetical protein